MLCKVALDAKEKEMTSQDLFEKMGIIIDKPIMECVHPLDRFTKEQLRAFAAEARKEITRLTCAVRIIELKLMSIR